MSSRRKISVTVQFAPFVKPYCVLIAADAAVLLISGRLDHIAVTNKLRCFAVDRFRADARKHSEFAGKGADDIVRGVYGDTDNMDSFFFVWQSVPSADLFFLFFFSFSISPFLFHPVDEIHCSMDSFTRYLLFIHGKILKKTAF